jgi:hypothetical protein
MKKLVCLLALAALSVSSAYAGQPAATGITESVHDMNVYVGATPDEFGRSCVFCHTPHNAQPIDPLNPVPLWNHEWSTADFSAGVYQWATPENMPLVIADPLIGPTRLCMSCHDGTVAIDQHGPSRSFAGTTMLTGDAAVGRNADLTDDHPIGFSYGTALTERNTVGLNWPELALKTDLFAEAVTASVVAGTYDTVDRTLGGRTIGDVLYQGDIMTCASCHEVHNKENVVQDVGTLGYQPNYLLYAKETDSLICLSCHLK